MKSLVVGIARTGSFNNQLLNPGNRYISMCGNKPEVTFSIDCDQYKFLQMINGLRYDDADPSSSAEAISFFQELMTKLFEDLKYVTIDENDSSPLHIKLVTSPFELAQLPFEFVMAPPFLQGDSKASLLTHPERVIALTREVRQESEARYVWPHNIRILFAWAQPADEDMSTPHEEHLVILQDIVAPHARPISNQPNPQPNIGDLLVELRNASAQGIEKKIEEGIAENKPFTHIHILAHGGEKAIFGVTEFQLLLCKDGTNDTVQKVDGKTLAKALLSPNAAFPPTVVSLSVCDSGHVGNTILPTGSLVYQLHTAGIPCVFASQFPLTQPGSVALVKSLYQQLIDVSDPRIALYIARSTLTNNSTHDWASLVAYARFPEDIDEQLQAAHLKRVFNSMKITNAWVDHVFKFLNEMDSAIKEPALLELEKRLTKSIANLSSFLNPQNNYESILGNELLQAEHHGLLGSAYKRKAEYLFRLVEFNSNRKSELFERSMEALKTAKQFYSCGVEANPTSHWTATQYLSLKAVTEGSLKDENELWYVTKRMAEREEKKAKREEDRIWAWGTLAELYLLKALTVQENALEQETISAKAIAKDYICKVASASDEYVSAKESTARQLDRYINWWPNLFPETYPIGFKDLATEIRNVLPPLDELVTRQP